MTHEIETSTLRTFESTNDRATTRRTQQMARKDVRRMLTSPSRWIGPRPEPSDEELMQEIDSSIKEDRWDRGEGAGTNFSSGPDTPREAS